MMGNKKLQVWLPLIFSVVMIVGMFLGYGLGSKSGNSKGFFSSNKRGSVQEVLDLIKMRYVDNVQVDSLEGKAIQEMMNELDPHSVYFPPVDVQEANEDLAGNFEGIGVEFNVFSDTVNVVYVIPGGPSDKAGLIIGDKIVSVNDSSLTRKKFSTDEIKKLIRGERGSKAILKIVRNNQLQTVAVTRGTIPVPSLDAAYMLNKETGYIKLNKFTETSYEEFMKALEDLKGLGMKSLILDLRGNGGGFMNEAVDMADEFLDGDKLIVYTEGANNKKKEYRCKRPGLFEKGDLVVLVDELSASASEVLAGALQDWCRAKIIGRRTFGKGLVQEQYPLSDGAAIRLTVARYYTPLGRSIQRSYEKGKKVYMDELWERFSSGEMLSADSLKNHNNGKQFLSVCKDTLYGGDGITPNIFVPFDTSRSLQRTFRYINNSKFSSFVYNYYLEHRQQIDQLKSPDNFIAKFSHNEDLWTGLLKYTADDTINYPSATSKEKELLELRLKALLARYMWRNSGFYQVLNSDDPVVNKALEVINKK
ncbi:MAG TPA: S41 family peptidase [Chitinophagaceae bacterium]|nr:S41 family peptidase [Chitinophagaceae bacterium]